MMSRRLGAEVVRKTTFILLTIILVWVSLHAEVIVGPNYIIILCAGTLEI